MHLRSLLPVVAFVSVTAVTAGASAAMKMAPGFPMRIGTPRGISSSTLDGSSGINHADCLDAKQHWRFSLLDVPEGATHVEMWATHNGSTCVPAEARAGATASCFLIARFDKDSVAFGTAFVVSSTAIAYAAHKRTSAAGAMPAAAEACAAYSAMPPTPVQLTFLPVDATGVPVDAEVSVATVYDLAGPNPPKIVSVATASADESAEGGLVATLSMPFPASDYKGTKLYCVPVAADAPCDGGTALTEGAPPNASADALECGSGVIVEQHAIAGLTPGQRYAVAAAAIDTSGNHGFLSAFSCATAAAAPTAPAPQSGGGDAAASGGGCTTSARGVAGSGLGALLVGLAALARRRRALGSCASTRDVT